MLLINQPIFRSQRLIYAATCLPNLPQVFESRPIVQYIPPIRIQSPTGTDVLSIAPRARPHPTCGPATFADLNMTVLIPVQNLLGPTAYPSQSSTRLANRLSSSRTSRQSVSTRLQRTSDLSLRATSHTLLVDPATLLI